MTVDPSSVNSQDERILLVAAQSGDEEAFGRLAGCHLPGLELFCRLMLGCPHEAHEAVGETLLRGWRELRRSGPSVSARTWLYSLATDVCLEGLDGTDDSRGPRPFDDVRDRTDDLT